MVAGEPDSMPAHAHLTLCLHLSSLAGRKTLGAHARIQAFRRQCARFFERASLVGWALGVKTGQIGPGAGSERAKGEPGRAGRWERKRPSDACAFVF